VKTFIKLLGAIIILGLASFLLGAGCSSDKTEESAATSSEVVAQHFAAKHANAVETSQYMRENPDAIVLDVRTPGEYAQGHIPNATLIDFKAPDFKDNLAGLDRDAAYIVHCRSGGRSTKSLTAFKELGFTNVLHLDGGFLAWQKAGLPIAE